MSVRQPPGDVISPSTHMNNTNTGLFVNSSEPGGLAQQPAGAAAAFGMQPEDGSGSNQHLASMPDQQQHDGGHSSMLHPAAAPDGGYGRSDMIAELGGLHQHDPLHPDTDHLSSHPLMLTTADSLLSQGSTDLCGLGDGFDVDGEAQQHHHHAGGSSFGTAAAATRISIDMQDVLNPGAGLPGVHSSSPQLHAGSHSPGLSHFGGSGHTANMQHGGEAYTADSLKSQQQQNGTHYGSLAQPQQQQQHKQQQQQQQQPQQRQSSQAQQRQGYSGSARASSSAAAAAGGGGEAPAQPVFRSQYRGVSYDKKKRKWRVQIKVAALGKSGVSVGYFDTEDAAARAYDRAAIGLLGRQNCKAVLNFPIEEYDNDSVPELVGKSREEVKATLKSERAKLPRRRLTHRRRTSRFLGVGSSNRKNQWQARILYHGKVTHLGYYRTEEEAARVYDKVSISLHGAGAQTNFPIDQYKHEVGSLQQKLSGLTREELQRALGVKPMDKSSRYRGVSKKKGRWEAKVMLNRKWAYREMFDTEADAARAYDTALWRLKPREARNYANFKDTCPPDVEEMLATLEKDTPLALHPTGLPLTAKPLIDAGLLYDDEGQSIKAPNGLTRSVSIGDLISVGDSAGQSVSEEPSAGNGSAGRHPLSGDGASGGAVGAVAGAGAGAAEGISSMARPGPAAAGMGGLGGMVKSASYSALSGLDGTVTSSLAAATDPAAAAAAPVPLSSLPPSARGALRGELTHVHLQPVPGDPFGQHQQQQHMGSSFGQQHRGMTRVQSVPQLRTYGSNAGSPTLPPMSGGGGGGGGGSAAHGSGIPGLPSFGSMGGSGYGGQYEQQQWMGGSMGSHPQHQHQQQMQAFGQGQSMQGSSHMALKAESAYWTPELSYPLPDHSGYHQQQHQQQQQHGGMRASRSCGNLAFMAGGGSSMNMAGMQGPGSGMHHGGSHVASPPGSGGGQPYGGSSGGGGGAPDFAGESKPLMVRVGSEQHLLNPNPNPPGGVKGMSRIASESHLASMVPLSPGHGFLGPDRGLLDAPAGFGGGGSGGGYQQVSHGMHGYGASSHGGYGAPPFGGMPPYSGMQQQGGQHQHQHQQQQVMYSMGGGGQQAGGYALSSSPGAGGGSYMQQAGMQQLQPGSMHISLNAPPQGVSPTGGMPPLSPVRQQQQQAQQQQQQAQQQQQSAAAGAGSGRVFRTSSSGSMHRAHSAAALESIDEMSVFRLQGMRSDMEASGQLAARGHSLPGSLGALPPGSSGHPVSASGAYLAQQQQQQQHGGMVPSGGGFGGGMPPISSALPVPQEHSHQHQQHHHHHQQQQYGQGMMGGGGFGGPSASAMHMTQAGAGGPGGSSSGGMHYGGSSMGPPGSAGAASAAAAAAAFDAMSGGHDKWDVLGAGRPVAPDSPLGVVQIGGEELDVTMTFLTDHSPGHLGGPDDGLDITGLLTDPSSMRPPSPPISHTTSALLFSDQAAGAGGAAGAAAAAGDTAIKMDE